MIFTIVGILYLAIAVLLFIGFSIHKPEISENGQLSRFSIIIPFRNEEKNILKTLESVCGQDYPKDLIELMLIDDASSDRSAYIAEAYLAEQEIKYTILTNQIRSGKKHSLEAGIKNAGNEWIVTRDADTYANSNEWLRRLSDYIGGSNKKFIIMPVIVKSGTGILSVLQEVESRILILFMAASANLKKPFLCSGANLCYHKSILDEVGHFDSHRHIESGDDYFLLQELARKDSSLIGYLGSTDTIVFTYPIKQIKGLVSQKIRWASKLLTKPLSIPSFVGLIITAANILFIIAVCLAFIRPNAGFYPLIFLFSKLIIDILLVFLTARIVKIGFGGLRLGIVSLAYPFYQILVFLLTMVGSKPDWKK